jgi:hypothetical protein
MHWERYHQTDCPTSIFSTLLSSDTGKLVTSGWGDFWEVLFIRTSRKFKDINFIPFPKKFKIREKWLKALKLSENDLKASSRVCSFHFLALIG